MRTTKKPSRSEHEEQRAFVEWWRKTQRDMIFAIPNGGARGKAQAGKLRAEGVMPGVWDLCAPERYLWIEMKVGTGRLSKEQREFGKAMLGAGYHCIVAWSCDDAIQQVQHGPRLSWSSRPG